jgi:hypothetical protein
MSCGGTQSDPRVVPGMHEARYFLSDGRSPRKWSHPDKGLCPRNHRLDDSPMGPGKSMGLPKELFYNTASILRSGPMTEEGYL